MLSVAELKVGKPLIRGSEEFGCRTLVLFKGAGFLSLHDQFPARGLAFISSLHV